ncbi:MAG: Gfo/Idh/MocA family oxidoreductase [Lachnospiraceae bacterium]|nr:Gfo/Idh/MocA family oxidoreductase [Lachnospiraceae bacterium]
MKIGIIGAGNIATTMATTLQSVKGAECYAVAARDIKRARDFANKYGFLKAYGAYSDMLSDPEVELVYIATPHSHHYDHIKMCLDHGKHVICEKAFTANAAQAQEVIRLAEERGIFITEAIWTRYMPMRETINRIIKSGIIGNPTSLSANLGYPLQHIKRMVKLELAGGALLDLGVYVINFASMVFGDDIKSIMAECIKYDSGVDAQETIMFSYADGKMASLYATMLAQTDRRGIINGTNGYIEIENINNYESIRVYNLERRIIAEHAAPLQITGYEYEINSAMRAIREGRLECPEMPHYETIRMMQLMDSMREAWGIRFPFENENDDEAVQKNLSEKDKGVNSGKEGKKKNSKGSVRMITEQTVREGTSKEIDETNLKASDSKGPSGDQEIADDEIQKMIRSIPTPPIDKRGESKRKRAGTAEDTKQVVQYMSKPVEEIKSRPKGMRAESLDEMREKLNEASDQTFSDEEGNKAFLGDIVPGKEKERAGRIEFIDEGVADELLMMREKEAGSEKVAVKYKVSPPKAGKDVLSTARESKDIGKDKNLSEKKDESPSLKAVDEKKEKPIETVVDDSLKSYAEEPRKRSVIGRFFDSVFKGEGTEDGLVDEDEYREDE